MTQQLVQLMKQQFVVTHRQTYKVSEKT